MVMPADNDSPYDVLGVGEAVIFKVGQMATVVIDCPLHGEVVVKQLVGWRGLVVDKVQCPFGHPQTDDIINVKVTILRDGSPT